MREKLTDIELWTTGLRFQVSRYCASRRARDADSRRIDRDFQAKESNYDRSANSGARGHGERARAGLRGVNSTNAPTISIQ